MDKGINLHKELAMGLPGAVAEAEGKRVKEKSMGTSLPKSNLKGGGKVAKKKGKK